MDLDDKTLANVTDATEQQLTNQQQIGGNLASTQPEHFEFILNPYVDSQSKKIGVREGHCTTNVRQVGQFMPQQNLTKAIADGLHQTIQKLIFRERIPATYRIYFNLASNRLVNNYAYRGLPTQEWLNGRDHVDRMLQKMSLIQCIKLKRELNDSFQ